MWVYSFKIYVKLECISDEFYKWNKSLSILDKIKLVTIFVTQKCPSVKSATIPPLFMSQRFCNTFWYIVTKVKMKFNIYKKNWTNIYKIKGSRMWLFLLFFKGAKPNYFYYLDCYILFVRIGWHILYYVAHRVVTSK